MTYYLIAQSTYADIELGIAIDGRIQGSTSVSKLEASSHILVALGSLLKQHNLALSDLAFIAANSGPGPFTTLRVLLSTINGLGYAAKIPLLGIDGLNAFLREHHSSNFAITIALLNAFTNDVYYGIDDNGKVEIGCLNGHAFLESLQEKHPATKIRFIGSGLTPYKDLIQKLFGSDAIIADPLPPQSSLPYLAQQAYNHWLNKQNITDQIIPLYLKNQINNIQVSTPFKAQ